MTRYNPMFMSQVTVRPSSCWHCFFARWLADVWHVGQLHRQMAILIEIWWYRLNNNVQTSPMTNHSNHDTHPIGCIWYTDCRWWCSYDTQIKVDTADHGTVNATGIEGTAHFQSKNDHQKRSSRSAMVVIAHKLHVDLKHTTSDCMLIWCEKHWITSKNWQTSRIIQNPDCKIKSNQSMHFFLFFRSSSLGLIWAVWRLALSSPTQGHSPWTLKGIWGSGGTGVTFAPTSITFLLNNSFNVLGF